MYRAQQLDADCDSLLLLLQSAQFHFCINTTMINELNFTTEDDIILYKEMYSFFNKQQHDRKRHCENTLYMHIQTTMWLC